jgi:predicted transcriptional regulator
MGHVMEFVQITVDKAYAGLDFLFARAKPYIDLDDEVEYIDENGYLFLWREEEVAATAELLTPGWTPRSG